MLLLSPESQLYAAHLRRKLMVSCYFVTCWCDTELSTLIDAGLDSSAMCQSNLPKRQTVLLILLVGFYSLFQHHQDTRPTWSHYGHGPHGRLYDCASAIIFNMYLAIIYNQSINLSFHYLSALLGETKS